MSFFDKLIKFVVDEGKALLNTGAIVTKYSSFLNALPTMSAEAGKEKIDEILEELNSEERKIFCGAIARDMFRARQDGDTTKAANLAYFKEYCERRVESMS